MSEEKKDPQVDPAVPTVEGETKEPIEPSNEELKQELERKEIHIKTLQGSLKAAQQRGVPKEELVTLHKKIDDMQEWNATVLDDLANRMSGEEGAPPVRKSYRQQLDETRKSAPEPKKEVDPETQKFINYLDSHDLVFEDKDVQEAIAEDRTPQEALKYLKGKVDEKGQATIDKRAEEKAKTIVEQTLKEMGLTAPGAGEPSGPSSNWQDLTPNEKILRGVSGKK